MKCNPGAVCKGAIVFEKEKWDCVRASLEHLWARAEEICVGVCGREKDDREREKVKWRKRHSWNSKADGEMEVENKRK